MNFIFSQFVAAKNSAVFLQKIEAKPAAMLVQSRTQQKSFLFLLEEKIRRAQNEKSKEYFSVVRRVVASGGGAASFVGIHLVKSSDFVQEGQPHCMNRKGCRAAKPRGNLSNLS
ncbi:MAG: hypothetical protein A3D59_04325 [Candidatus Wildermuthbacteria bacterium RIFCSPHIGHO2_02_FULL_47_17]|uniref:Uncharacterized protein n=1 Tax=Candidatus Wildermuthbacteria bacterium RIFCSPHIGHO2_02_FULL_47_17 TaxID=1802452 RepID=A0A1G2R7L7_9BACT|nr:MAG: hypothetical protein A3D59_04325 [Candidatus Wildermuthbacteria bacterium RIFCSPHIGHO2_02_FULL_47_17]